MISDDRPKYFSKNIVSPWIPRTQNNSYLLKIRKYNCLLLPTILPLPHYPCSLPLHFPPYFFIAAPLVDVMLVDYSRVLLYLLHISSAAPLFGPPPHLFSTIFLSYIFCSLSLSERLHPCFPSALDPRDNAATLSLFTEHIRSA